MTAELIQELRSLREEIRHGVTDPYVTGEEAARILCLKNARCLPRDLTRYFPKGKGGTGRRALYKREDVVNYMKPQRGGKR